MEEGSVKEKLSFIEFCNSSRHHIKNELCNMFGKRCSIVFENLAEGVLVIQDGYIVYANHFLHQKLNKKEDDIVGKTIEEIIENDKFIRFNDKGINKLELRFQAHFAFDIKDKTGTLRTFFSKVLTIFWEEEPAVICFLEEHPPSIDIVSSVQELDVTIKTLMNNMPGMFYRCKNDPDNTILYLSEGCHRIIGYTQKQYITEKINFASLIHPLDYSLVQEEVKKSLEKKGSYEVIYRIIRTDNSIRWVKDTGYGIYKEGKLLFLEGMLIDITDQKNGELSLVNSEKKYRSIFDNTGTSMMLIGKDTVIKMVNTEFAILSGYPKEELEGKMSWTVFIDPAYVEMMKKYHNLRRTGSTDVPRNYECIFIGKDKKKKKIYLTVSMIPGTTDSVASLMDITNIDKAKEKIKELEKISGELIKKVPLGVFIYKYVSPDSLFLIEGNPKAEELTKTKMVSAVGKFMYDIWPGLAGTGIDKIGIEVMESGNSKVYNMKFCNRDFKVHAFKITHELLGVAFEDITEILDAENQLRSSREQLEKIMNSTSELILGVDKEGTIKAWNRTAERKTGYASADILDLDIYTKEDKNLMSLFELVKVSLKTKQTEMLEHSIKDKDGNRMILLSESSFIKDTEGNIEGVVIVSRDITGKINMHEKLVLGNSYITYKENQEELYDIIVSLNNIGHKILCLSRGKKYQVVGKIKPDICKHYYFVRNEPDLPKKILEEVSSFLNLNKRAVVYLDRLDYLMMNFGYAQMMSFLYDLADMIKGNGAIMIMRAPECLFDKKQFNILLEEFFEFPSHSVDKIYLSDKKIEILKFIHHKNYLHASVNLNQITKKFGLSRITTRNWIRELQEMGLIRLKKQGKVKLVILTKKGNDVIMDN